MSLTDARPMRVRERINVFPKRSVSTAVTVDKNGVITAQNLWPTSDVISKDRCADQVHPGPPYREGGPLFISKNGTSTESLGVFSAPYYSGSTWYADFRPLNVSGWFPYDVETWGDPTNQGATAWRRFKPGRPGATIAQAFAEIRDLPRLFKVRVSDFRGIGSQYLNYQFGWMNLLRDIQSFTKTVENMQKRFDFLKKNNGKWKRRYGVLLDETETTLGDTNFNVTPSPATPYFKDGTFRHTSSKKTTITKKIWFEARMKFFIPNLESPSYRLYEVNKALGALPTPSLVYELMPWSWLLDYFGNLGDIIDNMSYGTAAENLVAKYAYVMSTYKFRVDYSTTFTLRKTIGTNSAGLRDFQCFYSNEFVNKWRVPANPFGFGTSWDLNPGQLAILTALGISNFPRFR